MLLGFLFRDRDHVEAFLASDKHAEFKDNLVAKAGIRIITDNGIGAPRVLIAKSPVDSPADMKGMNMRVPNIEMYMKTWTAVGVNVVQVPWGEAYMALKQGIADALEAPLGSIYGMKFHEAAKNISLTNHLYSIYVMAMNENTFKNLPQDVQDALVEAAKEAGELFVKYDSEAVATRRQAMIDSGVNFIENPDIAAFQAQLSTLAAELENAGMWPKGLYDYVQGLR
jgi:TRAP-type C4-dicarboxylate transport system substrate-binding protein